MDEQNLQPPLRYEERAAYAQSALTKLAGAWMQPKPNLSGMRATFKRWRPEADGAPTPQMRQYVWGWIGSPYADAIKAQEDETGETFGQVPPAIARDEEALIDEAATIVAIRAVAGDHQGELSIGQALHRAGLSDMRLMRLLTSGKKSRLEDLIRCMKLIDKNRLGIKWSSSEVQNVYLFLFGSDRTAQRAANNWAADFFRYRGKKADDKKEQDKQPADE